MRINDQHPSEVNHLFWRDEILQVMYWLFGENLGTEVSIEQLVPLLSTSEENLVLHIKILVDDGYLDHLKSGSYVLTDFGRKEAGQRFAGAFQGLQKAGHGECSADCDCQWEGHDSCQHHLHQNCDH